MDQQHLFKAVRQRPRSLLHLMQIVEGHSVHCTAVRPHHDIRMHGHTKHARTEQLATRDEFSNRDSRQLLTVHTQVLLIVSTYLLQTYLLKTYTVVLLYVESINTQQTVLAWCRCVQFRHCRSRARLSQPSVPTIAS